MREQNSGGYGRREFDVALDIEFVLAGPENAMDVSVYNGNKWSIVKKWATDSICCTYTLARRVALLFPRHPPSYYLPSTPPFPLLQCVSHSPCFRFIPQLPIYIR